MSEAAVLPASPELPDAAAAPAAAPARSLTARVFGATGAISGAGALVRLVALAAAPLLTRLLGPEPYGTFALLGTIAALLAGSGTLGLDFSYSRYFLAGEGDEARDVERFCWRTALGLGSLAAAAGAAAWVWIAAPRTGADPRLAWLVAASVLLTVLTTLSQTRARIRGEYLRLAWAVLVTGAVTTGGSLALALAGWRTAWALVLGSAAGLAAGVAVAGVVPAGELTRRAGLSAAQRRAVVSLGLPTALTTLLYWAMTSADRWVVAWFLPPAVLGSYSFAATLAAMGLILNNALMQVWFPEAVRTYEAARDEAPVVLGRLWTRLVTVLAVVWLAVAMSGGDLLRLLTDPRFHDGAVYIPWLAGGVFFYGLAQLSATAMVLRKDQRPQAVWWLIGAAACVGAQVALVPRVGAVAAAAASCGAFALIAAGVLWVSERWLPLRVQWGRLLAAVAGIAAVGVLGTPAWSGTPLASLAIKLPVGMAVGALAVAWVAPDWARRGLDAVGSRLRRGAP